MTVTVVITTYYVPFPQVVQAIKHFDTDDEALAFINQESKKWWDEMGGERCLKDNWQGKEINPPVPYEPIKQLGYDVAEYSLWGGEAGFHAMLDHTSYARLHNAHVDAMGFVPGYLQAAYAYGGKPK